MSMKAIKIETDGSIGAVEITGKNVSEQNDSIYKYLGGHFDIVRMGRDACMLVDDEGLLKGLQQNLLAMMISGYPLLVGTALIVGTQPGPDGDEFTDAPERFVKLADELNGAPQIWEEAEARACYEQIERTNEYEGLRFQPKTAILFKPEPGVTKWAD